MEATSPSPLVRWLGHMEFEALARGACAAPRDDAPRLVLADWLRDRGDDAAADEVEAAGPFLVGWLAIAHYERQNGHPPGADLSHLTGMFRTWGQRPPDMDETSLHVRRTAAGMIVHRAAVGRKAR